jgi:hypothetical protein
MHYGGAFMIAEVSMLIFAVIGILSILRFLIFKFISIKEDKFTLVLPVFSEEEEIFSRIENLREFLEFSGIHKKSTVVLINYDAPDWFCKKIESCFPEESFIKIAETTENIFKE